MSDSILRKAANSFGSVFTLGVMGPHGMMQIPQSFSPGDVLGSTGAKTYGGYPDLGERNKKLIGPDRYRTYDNKVATLAIVGSGVRLFLDLLAGAEWATKAPLPPASTTPAAKAPPKPKKPGDSLEPPKKAPEPTPEAQRIADLVAELVLDGTATTWSTIIKYLGGYRYYDNRVAEVIYGRRANGYIGIADISPRPNHTITHWSVDLHGDVDGVVQLVPQIMEYVPLPRGKLVIIADNTVSSMPEGLGLLRHTIDSANRLERLLELEAIGYETTMEGMPIGYLPYQALNQLEASGQVAGFKAATYLAPVENAIKNKVVTRQRGVTLDSQPFLNPDKTLSAMKQFSIDVLRSSGNGQSEIDKAIERENRMIAVILGVEHLLLGGNKGAYNLAKDKSDRLVALINSTLKELAAALKRDVILPIMRMNGWDEALAPDLIPSDVSQLDVDGATAALLRLAQAGELIGSPTRDTVADVIRKRLGLPERPEIDPTDLLIKDPTSPDGPLAGADEGNMDGDPEAGSPVGGAGGNGKPVKKGGRWQWMRRWVGGAD